MDLPEQSHVEDGPRARFTIIHPFIWTPVPLCLIPTLPSSDGGRISLWNSATANDQIAEYGLVSENHIATVASKLFLLMLARKRLLIVGIHCSDFMAWAAHLYKLTTCIWKKKANRKKSTTMNHPYKYGPCQEIFSVNNPYNQGSCWEIVIVHHCYK